MFVGRFLYLKINAQKFGDFSERNRSQLHYDASYGFLFRGEGSLQFLKFYSVENLKIVVEKQCLKKSCVI